MLNTRSSIRLFLTAFLCGVSFFAVAQSDLSISRELEFHKSFSVQIFDLISTPTGTLSELLQVPGVESLLAENFKSSDRNFLAQIKFDSLTVDLKFAIANLIIQNQILDSKEMISYERPLHLHPLVLRSGLPIVLHPGESLMFQGINYSNESGRTAKTVQIDLTKLFRPTAERLFHGKNLGGSELHLQGPTVSELIDDTSNFFEAIFPRRIDADPTEVVPMADHFHFVAEYDVFYETNVARLRALQPSNQSSAIPDSKLFALAATLWILDLELARTYSDFADNDIPSTLSIFTKDSTSRFLAFDWMDPSDIPLVFNFFQDFSSATEFEKKMEPETRARLKTNLNGPRKGIFRATNLFSIEARLSFYSKAQNQKNSKTRTYLESLHSVMRSNRVPEQYLKRAVDMWKESSGLTSPVEILSNVWMKTDLNSLKNYFANTNPTSVYHGRQARTFRRAANHFINSEEFKSWENDYRSFLGTEKVVRYPGAFFILVPWADYPILRGNEELRRRVFEIQLRALSESIDDEGYIIPHEAQFYGRTLQNLMGELTFIELSKGKLESSDIQSVFNKAPFIRLEQTKVDTSSIGLKGKLKSLLSLCSDLF